ncbi:MAG: hypothetical protein ACP5N7_00905 [Candidatus Pacearchaeota archaeon]
MILELSIILILSIIAFLLLANRSEELNLKKIEEQKEKDSVDQTQWVKDKEHSRDMEKLVVEKTFEHLPDFVKLEEAKRPHPLPPTTIHIENLNVKKKA